MILMKNKLSRRGALGVLAGAGAAFAFGRPAFALSPDAARVTIDAAVDEVYAVIDSGLPEAEMLARFTEDSHALARDVRWGEAGFIEDRIRRGRRIRRGLIERQQA